MGAISGLTSAALAAPGDPTLPPAPPAAAADAVVAPAPQEHDIRQEIPLLAYTTSAFGAPRLTVGGLGYGGVLGASGPAGLRAGGGGRIWGSPVDRLTIILDVSRPLDDKDKAAKPSATVLFRAFGSQAKGYAVSAGMTYRTDGFADFGGELEGTLLFSLARGKLHADANVTFGGAVTDEAQEADGEAKLRVGYDVTSWLRVGLDGRFRYRLLGATSLPGNRLGDAVGGPEVIFSYKHFFFSADGGPSTVGVVKGIGGSVLGTVGAAIW